MALFDALHFPLFALLTLLIYACLTILIRCSPMRCLLLAMSIVSIMAVSSELAQPLFHRTSSWRDFCFDLIGIAAAAGTIFLSWKRNTPGFLRLAAVLGALFLASIAVVAQPALRAARAQNQQADAFPLMGDFEHGWESLMWHAQGKTSEQPVTASRVGSDHSSQGNYSLLIRTDAASWAGVHLLFGKRLAWSDRHSLHFDIFNPADRFELGVRVDGFDDERYSGAVQIEPGANSCRIRFEELANRELTLADLDQFEAKQITLHLGEPPATRTFYLDNVRLE
jgi:hypothetical protein